MKVRDIMTRNVVSAVEDMPAREVAQLLARYRVSGLPVCDKSGHIAGVVSEYDLIAKPDAKTAGEAMSRDVISVMEETSVEEVRFLLINRNIKRVPVLSGQRVVGVVSRGDLIREIAMTWVCQVCGDHERGQEPPEVCPRCGTASGYQPSSASPAGEGADVATPTCPTCGQRMPLATA